MPTLHLLHVVFLCLWAGVVLGEGVLELSARDDVARAHVARVHFLIDVWLELPLLVLVLASGTLLVASVWPLSALHWIKISVGLVAVAVNLNCVAIVIRRHRQSHDVTRLRTLGRHVRWSFLGVPFGLLAAVIGFAYFHA